MASNLNETEVQMSDATSDDLLATTTLPVTILEVSKASFGVEFDL
jgi:hypothetical protein